MPTTTSNAGSRHICDVCGDSFMYPAEYRPWGLPSGDPDKGEACCPCDKCDPEAFRSCVVQSVDEGDLDPGWTSSA